MIEHLVSQWRANGSPWWLIVASVFVGIAVPLFWWVILEKRERGWRKEREAYWKKEDERLRGPHIHDVRFYDLALTAEQVKWLHDLPQPVWTAPWM